MTRPSADRDERIAQVLRSHLSAEAGSPRTVLLAVSGGPDSTALMHAAATYRAGASIHVATVDHGLRLGSTHEAEEVGALARTFGLPHRILPWGSPRHGSGIQAAARAARYDLLRTHAAEIGASMLLTAHTADDQAETVLMRLIAGSGPAGLAGMRPRRRLGDDLWLARPFLTLPKADLVAYCEGRGLPFVRDPSNGDERFARARLRKLLPMLAEQGLSGERLRRLAERLARNETALSFAADAALADARRDAGPGELVLIGDRLRAQPDATVLRVFDLALGSVEPEPSRPSRLERLERLVLDEILPALRANEQLRRTLRGVLVEVEADGALRFSRAPPRRAARAPGSVAAARSDLLGNDPGTAYIGSERVGSIPLQSGTARTPPRISR